METTLLVSSMLLWLVVVLNLFLTFALVRRFNATSRLPDTGGLPVGTVAPNFTAHTLSGETKTLADYRGRNLALVFISSQCQPCRDLLPSLKQMESRAQQANIDLVLVNGEGQTASAALVDEMALSLPLLVAPRPENPFFSDYHILGTPSYCFVTPQGIVSASGFPSLQSGEWTAFTAFCEKGEELYVSSERR